MTPSAVGPGAEVTIGTSACGADGTATGDASAVGAGTFQLAPGIHGDEATGRFTVPAGAQPGTYEIAVRCSGATGGRPGGPGRPGRTVRPVISWSC